MTDQSKSHHDWHSQAYVDDWIEARRLEDEAREERFRFIAKLMPFASSGAVGILDLGGGYGPLCNVMADAFPNARLVLQDYSEAMLSRARERLSPHGNRIRFVSADLMSPDWSDVAGGPFHAVVSSLCLHNLGSAERVREIYAEVFELLGPGGCFFDIDLVNAPDAELAWTYTRWMASRGQPGADPAGTIALAASEWDAGRRHAFPARLEEKLDWLRRAGFSAVDCWWKEMGLALVGGFRL
jgi:tRNA (cmo5U34)-methyltransferase